MPQDLFQTAKIAKLFLLMERGINKDNEGKTLDQIDIELTEMESDETSINQDIEEYIILFKKKIRCDKNNRSNKYRE